MSEIMLNVCDSARALHATTHASRVDCLVAALSADPETIEELQAALARFLPAEPQREFFASWRSGARGEPVDAGLCLIDLAARLVIVRSTYSSPGPRGEVCVTDTRDERTCWVPYHVAADWLFTDRVESWPAVAEARRRTRPLALDARAVLYGSVCEFIAEACAAEAAMLRGPLDEAAVAASISSIHARWLTIPRVDLHGQTPRDVLLARHDHVERDLRDRAEQWSRFGACPPGLSPESAAYRYGGFGTHEIVLYYDLVRLLLWDSWECPARPHAAEVRRLEALRDEWLATPDLMELDGRTPASVIERERARLPEGVTGAEAMVDPDCPLCQLLADDLGPMFWHLDCCNMDDDFAFSFHRTREEWEAERREWEEFDRRYQEEQRGKQPGASDSVWQRSFSFPDVAGDSPALELFGLGAHLAELIVDLKDAGADQGLIDDLNRVFGNLRETIGNSAIDLAEPVSMKMAETLAAVAEAHPTLAEKCADLENQMSTLVRRLANDPSGDDELPF